MDCFNLDRKEARRLIRESKPKSPYQQAKENGDRFYFTGNPCKLGHVENRYVKGGKCIKCRFLIDAAVPKNVKNRYIRNHWANNRENCKKRNNEFYKNLRTKAIEYLGGKCIKCGNSDHRVLHIDHVRGGGLKELRKLGRGPLAIHRRVLKDKSNKYQLLCASCNSVKRFENKENAGIKAPSYLRLKVLELFGNCCNKCGADDIRCLQLDHLNGGGTKEFKSTGSYYVYRRALTDFSEFQLLCANCNWIKRYTDKEVGNANL
jgi:hypothetical protein